MRLPFSITLAVSLLAAGVSHGAPEFTNETDKAVYALGLAAAAQLTEFDLSEREFVLLAAGMADGHHGEPVVSLEEYGPRIAELGRERATRRMAVEMRESEAFLVAAAAEPGARKTETGLIIRETQVGDGDMPGALDSVKVHYHGTLRDGLVFDSSVERGEPVVFPLERVIPCWTEALQRMKVGAKAVIHCPADLAYRDRGAAEGLIGPGAALRFEVELLGIE